MPSDTLHIDTARQLCLSLPEVEESQPFGEDYLVYKLYGKMVALIMLRPNREGKCGMNLKCHPDHALTLRDTYHGITAGYHMNKHHWNTLWFATDVPVALAQALVLHSADCVVAKLSKAQRTHYTTLTAALRASIDFQSLLSTKFKYLVSP